MMAKDLKAEHIMILLHIDEIKELLWNKTKHDDYYYRLDK